MGGEGAASQVAAGRDVTEQVDTEEQIRAGETAVSRTHGRTQPERLDAAAGEREKCKHDPITTISLRRMRELHDTLLRMRS